ncbi:MAG: hypothetical protein ACOCRX_01810 [Candidatus Woesearchaeota archaeon]
MAVDSIFSLVFMTRYFASFILFFLSLFFGYFFSLSIPEEYRDLKKYKNLIYSISLIPIVIFLFIMIRESFVISRIEFNYGFFSYSVMISIALFLFFHSTFKGMKYLNDRYSNIDTQTKFRKDTKENLVHTFNKDYYIVFLILFGYILLEVIFIWLFI